MRTLTKEEFCQKYLEDIRKKKAKLKEQEMLVMMYMRDSIDKNIKRANKRGR